MGVTVNWFEIPVTNVSRAAEFYGAVLGEPLGEMQGPDGIMRTFTDDSGANGALVPADANNSSGASGTLVYLNCPDIDGALERAKGAGGRVQQARTSIGPFGFIGTLLDPDGNRIGLHTPPG